MSDDDMSAFVSLETVLNFMHASEESVKRCVSLSPKIDVYEVLWDIKIMCILGRRIWLEYTQHC